jgi:hypothetical protein
VRLSIRGCDHDCVSVEIFDPEFVVSGVRIDVNVSHDRGLELTGAGDDVLEIVHFEPEQDTVAYRLCRVADGTVMVIGMPIVQLQDQPVTALPAHVVPWIPKSFIFGTTMPADTSKQPLVPYARRLNVPTENERMCAHEMPVYQRLRSRHSNPH